MNTRKTVSTLAALALLAGAAAPPPLAAQDPPVRVMVRPAGPGGWIGFSFTTGRMPTGARRPVVVVTDVVEGSPAEGAGIAVGDTLLSVNGLAASEDLIGSLASSLAPGDEVTLQLRRDGRERRVELTAGERPANYVALSPRMGIVSIPNDTIMGRVRILVDSLNVSLQGHELPAVIAERMPFLMDSLGLRMEGMNRMFEGLPLRMDSLRLRMDSIGPGVWEFQGDTLGFRTRLRIVSPDSLRSGLFLRSWGDSAAGTSFMLADSLVRMYQGNYRLHMDSLFGDSARWRAFSLEGGELPRVFGFGDSLGVVAPSAGTWSFEVRGDRPVWRAFGAQAVGGARLQAVEGELASALDLGAGEGLLVLEVPDETPARRAGLQAGDLIVRAGGEPVSTVEELRRAVLRTPRGEEVALEVLRRRQRVRLSLPGG